MSIPREIDEKADVRFKIGLILGLVLFGTGLILVFTIDFRFITIAMGGMCFLFYAWGIANIMKEWERYIPLHSSEKVEESKN